jgi:hypothetical protein
MRERCRADGCGRRAAMGWRALCQPARGRAAGAARGDGRVRQPAAGALLQGAGRRLHAEARGGGRSRPPVRARAGGRHLFRHPARHRDHARWGTRGRQHPALQRKRDQALRGARLHARPGAQRARDLGRQGQCDGIGPAVARNGAGAGQQRPPRCRARPSLCRQCGDAAGARSAPVRRDPHRQSVRRHPLRPGRRTVRLDRAPAFGGARRGWQPGSLRADPRICARYRRARHRQPAGSHPQPGAGARTRDLGGALSTRQMGDAVLAAMGRLG